MTQLLKHKSKASTQQKEHKSVETERLTLATDVSTYWFSNLLSMAVSTASFFSTFPLLLLSSYHKAAAERDMKLQNVNLNKLLAQTEFVPQAVIEGRVEDMTKRLQFDLERDVDDFDEYIGTGLLFNEIPIAVMRYAGHPNDQYTIYLPFKITDTDKVTRIVHEIVHALKVPEKAIVWERKDNPDL